MRVLTKRYNKKEYPGENPSSKGRGSYSEILKRILGRYQLLNNPLLPVIYYFLAQHPSKSRKSFCCGPFEAEHPKRYQSKGVFPGGVLNTLGGTKVGVSTRAVLKTLKDTKVGVFPVGVPNTLGSAKVGVSPGEVLNTLKDTKVGVFPWGVLNTLK